MQDNDFFTQRQRAVERMKEMSRRSQDSAAPQVPHFVQKRGDTFKKTDLLPRQNAIDLPFLKNLSGDGDVSLILGLILLLFSENGDRMLLYALLYILI